MYAYNLLVESGDGEHWSEATTVRPGPDLELPTLVALREQVRHDLGFVPPWLLHLDPKEYIQVEDDVQVEGVWFVLDIEGSQGHELPPLAQRIAFERNHGKG